MKRVTVKFPKEPLTKEERAKRLKERRARAKREAADKAKWYAETRLRQERASSKTTPSTTPSSSQLPS